MNQANIFSVVSVAFILGVLGASYFEAFFLFIFFLALVLPFVTIIYIRSRKPLYIIFGLLAFLFTTAGAAHFYNAADDILNKEYANKGGSAFDAVIVETPDVRADKTFLVVESTDNTFENRARISTDNFINYSYGEHIYIEGELEVPENFEGFDYRGYLAKEDIRYVMRSPNISYVNQPEFSLLYLASSIKTRMREGIDRVLLPPHSSLYSAILLGDKGMLASDDKEMLQRAGLSHIVAISGMHIVILIAFLFGIALRAGMHRSYAAYTILILISFYILMIGAPASAVRAGIMGATLLIAERLGRPNSSWRALLLAGAVMVAFNPLLLRYDVGFQLSFLAVAGILLLREKIEYYLWKVPRIFIRRPLTHDRKTTKYIAEHKLGGVRGLLAMTFSAQIFTFPLILYHFGTFSLASPLSNLLVIPILPLVLPAGFIAALGGMIGGPIATVISAPAWLFSNYIWGVVGLFS